MSGGGITAEQGRVASMVTDPSYQLTTGDDDSLVFAGGWAGLQSPQTAEDTQRAEAENARQEMIKAGLDRFGQIPNRGG